MRIIAWALAFFFLFAAGASAQAPRKVALVIGNAAYSNATRLANPASDAGLIRRALGEAGFSAIELKTDVGLRPMQLALRDFAARARGADVALVYFAGHGLEAMGQNWLVPTDARLAADTDLEFEAVRLESVLRAVEGARVRIVILDACRDNPFARTMRRFSPTRAVSRGLVGVEADDVLIMYAAAAGQTAADGEGSHSPFAAALARRLPEPGLELRLMAGRVRDDVLAATQGAQRPFIAASITGEAIYLTSPPPRADAALQRELEAARDRIAALEAAPVDTSLIFQMRYVGEQPDGFLGVSRDVSENVVRLVAQTNARRREVYEERARSLGVTPAEFAAAAACQLFRRLSLGAVYKTENGEWRTNAGDVAVPSFCPH